MTTGAQIIATLWSMENRLCELTCTPGDCDSKWHTVADEAIATIDPSAVLVTEADLAKALTAPSRNPPMTDLVVIDASCHCLPCTSRTAATYDLPGRCLNCGARFIVRSRKGDTPPLGVECPACGVREYSWRDNRAIFSEASHD
jgi:hypothetical protein